MFAFHSGLETFNCAESREEGWGIMSLKFVFSPSCPSLFPLSLQGRRRGSWLQGLSPLQSSGSSVFWAPSLCLWSWGTCRYAQG